VSTAKKILKRCQRC